MLDFTETRGVTTGGTLQLIGEGDLLLQGLETGLAQQDGVTAGRWAFDHCLGFDALGRHAGLHQVDVEGTGCEMVDMRALERHHIGDQAVFIVQHLVLGGADGRLAVPAKRLQGLLDEDIAVVGGEPAVALELLDQAQGQGCEYLPLIKDHLGALAQRRVVDQLKPQQRGKDPKRADVQGLLVHSPERRGMHRHPGRSQVVVAHRLHAQHGKQAPHGGQFAGRAQADRTMALHVQAFDFACALQRGGNRRLLDQHLAVDLADQRKQVAIQRHFLFVHVRHGAGKAATQEIRADKGAAGHGALHSRRV